MSRVTMKLWPPALGKQGILDSIQCKANDFFLDQDWRLSDLLEQSDCSVSDSLIGDRHWYDLHQRAVKWQIHLKTIGHAESTETSMNNKCLDWLIRDELSATDDRMRQLGNVNSKLQTEMKTRSMGQICYHSNPKWTKSTESIKVKHSNQQLVVRLSLTK